jgi:phosphoribosylformylglycinamidine synthase
MHEVTHLKFSEMSDDEIKKVLVENKIGLTIDEAKKIEEILGRAPTLTEAVLWGIQGSEHCSYRSSRKYLKTLPTSAPNVILGPVEDSGVVEIAKTKDGDRYGIVISHESHNHPSQVVPYEGAATGIGGIVRDVTCMGAKVIGTLDPLRFGTVDTNEWCRIVAEEVVNGIGGYGNPIGVPNFGGDAYFDESFNDNCLVNVVCIGLVKESEIIHSYVPERAADENWDIIIVGKPTDNSGMGGAAFASVMLDEADKEANKGAVQEPNAFLKRHLLISTYDLFRKIKEEKLLDKVGFKDMGAGGNTCASVEMVDHHNLGAEIDLEKIHVALDDLHPSVIACAETQERFCWMCHPSITQMIVDHYNVTWDLPKIAANARASHVGTVKNGNYVLKYNNENVCDAKSKDITEGLRYDRKFSAPKRTFKEPKLSKDIDLSETLLKLLASENIASREPIYERYDKTVQGITVIDAGLADAGVLAPLIDEEDEDIKYTGVAIKADGNARYGYISPYWQAANALCECLRNVAAVGGTPQALTDCCNYGNPEKEDQMWELVEGIRGLKEAAENIHLKDYPDSPTPYISGNVSLYNESKKGSINPSAIVACVAKMDDFRKAITMQFKKTDSLLFLLGERKDECGGSEYYRLHGEYGKNVPQPDFKEVQNQIYTVIDAINDELVLSAHDISEGGVAVTLAEMTMRGDIGFEADLSSTSGISNDKKMFTETGGFVLEIPEDKKDTFLKTCEKYGVNPIEIGKTTKDKRGVILDGKSKLVELTLDDMKKKWHESLRPKIFA